MSLCAAVPDANLPHNTSSLSGLGLPILISCGYRAADVANRFLDDHRPAAQGTVH
jgi:hypothetical protein